MRTVRAIVRAAGNGGMPAPVPDAPTRPDRDCVMRTVSAHQSVEGHGEPARGYRHTELGDAPTEWDWNIFNQQYADSRMNNIREERIHRNGSTRPGFNDGERWITLGTGDLQPRLIYTVTSKPVVRCDRRQTRRSGPRARSVRAYPGRRGS